ncbi:reverse transcriptase family protein [Teredinibacter turnerae]|uniref:reverse transcriptase family protein n=1 Tax=Teredinibacter turnerae TaxID=2426 RepID=UPI0003692D0C|nr:reverse transcriptase family protein [Teredinibacter turnerae]
MAEKKLPNNKQRRLRLQTRGKQYSVCDSPFYKLCSKTKLAEMLGCTLPELKNLSSDEDYIVFNEEKSGKRREVQQPKPKLDKIHTRIGSLLARIKTPDYLHSGVKGRTHITNAKCHNSNSRILVTDVKSFYQSTTFKMIYGFFNHRMRCSPDVSWLLTKVSTYNNSIPTGSRLSMPLAFWSSIGMFEKLNQLSISESVVMTLYVDDLTFSGEKINKLFCHKVKKIVSSYGHLCHPKKTKIYNQNQAKVVTGVALLENGPAISNKQHKSIYEDMLQWEIIKNEALFESLNNRLLGKLNSQGQIDFRYKDKARSLMNEIRRRKPYSQVV